MVLRTYLIVGLAVLGLWIGPVPAAAPASAAVRSAPVDGVDRPNALEAPAERFPSVGGAGASSGIVDRAVDLELRALDLQEIEDAYREALSKYRDYLGDLPRTDLRSMITGATRGLPWSNAFGGVIRLMFNELVTLGALIATILLLTVFSTVLEHIQGAFEQRAVSRVAQYVTFLILSVLVLESFHVAADSAKQAIDTMSHIMYAFLPVLLSLIAASGGVLTAGLFHPFVLFLIHTSGLIIGQIVFPLFFFSTVLSLVSLFSEQYALNNLSRLLSRIAVTVLSIFFTVFLGVLSVQGTAAAVADGVTLRTAKYIVSNTVPVFGRMFSDATETVMGAAVLVKNALGLVGVFLLFVVAAFPAVKVFLLAFVYQFSSAVLQPLENGPIVRALEAIGGALMFIFAAMTALGIMFYLSLVLLIVAGNSTLFVR